MGTIYHQRRFLWITALLLLFVALFPHFTRAAAGTVDLVILIDNSGSMAHNDPRELRYRAARLAIDYLEVGDQVGVLLFDSTVEPLLPLSPLTGAGEKNKFKELIPARRPRGDTDIGGALAQAHGQLTEKGRGGAVPLVILLTDGIVDPDPARRYDKEFMAAYYDNMDKVVAEMADLGCAIYGVGLTEEADMDFLREVGSRSGGWSQMVPTAPELVPVFRDILQEAKERESLWERVEEDLAAGEVLEQKVAVPQYTREVTFTAVNLEGGFLELEVVGPRGQLLAAGQPGVEVSWEAGYASYRVSSPAAGEWLLRAAGQGRMHLVVETDSLFKARLVSPPVHSLLSVGEETLLRVEALTEEGMGAHGEIEIGAQLAGPQGGVQELAFVPSAGAAGLYEANYLFPGPGDYRISLWARRGDDYLDRREYTLTAGYPLTLNVVAPESGEYPPETRVLLQAEIIHAGRRLSPRAFDGAVNLICKISGPEGRGWEVGLYDEGDEEKGDILAGDGLYSANFSPPQPGEYTYRFSAAGRYQGEEFNLVRSLSPFRIMPPGQVNLVVKGDKFAARVGGTMTVELLVSSSYFEEKSVILAPEEEGVLAFEPVELMMPARGEADQRIKISLPKDLEAGLHRLGIEVRGEDGVLEDRIHIDLRLEPPLDLLPLVREMLPWLGGGLAGLLMLGWVVDMAGGRRDRRLAGVLLWSHPQVGGGREQAVDLASYRARSVDLSLGEGVFTVFTRPLVNISFIRGLYFLLGSRGTAYYIAPGPQKISRGRKLPPAECRRLYHLLQVSLGSYTFTLDNPQITVKLTPGRGRTPPALPSLIKRLQKYNSTGDGS